MFKNLAPTEVAPADAVFVTALTEFNISDKNETKKKKRIPNRNFQQINNSFLCKIYWLYVKLQLMFRLF